jgi:hypothetical protein
MVGVLGASADGVLLTTLLCNITFIFNRTGDFGTGSTPRSCVKTNDKTFLLLPPAPAVAFRRTTPAYSRSCSS